ncbi:ATP-binding cassette domain-containing protein [Paeniglutamicibacter antarcticus]|uniref:ABC transporter ATP-binding protein n=1 Tax=Paeniglutamicibacter antarcticus TaxID=494023 RepID=A0ABP9TF69_9MICC
MINALIDVDFSVLAGEPVGIVGESGSGKSALLRILAGLDQPSTGDAVVAGSPIAGAKAADLVSLRRDLQIVFQDPMGSLDPRMKIADIGDDIVAELMPVPSPGMGARERAAAVEAMLSLVGMEADSAGRYPHQFSGGQRQRVSIPWALVNRPSILLADEPLSALDVSVRARVLNLLAEKVREYSLTLLMVSRDFSVVRHPCDRVIVVRDERIVESGDTKQVYNHPAHP